MAATTAPAATTVVNTPAPTVIVREVARPTRGERAKAPPRNAKPTNAVHFDKRVKWKSNPKSKAVFAVDDGMVWFVDPETGWPYTIDRRGLVYTADALTGEVYSLGPLSDWEGDAPYFFDYWDYDDGGYVLEEYDAYEAIYVNEAIGQYAYEQAYDELWEYEDYFESEEFAANMIEIEAAELQAFADEDYELAKGEAELADAEAAVLQANAAEYDTPDAKALADDQAEVARQDAAEAAANAAAAAAAAAAAEADVDAAAADAADAQANDEDEADLATEEADDGAMQFDDADEGGDEGDEE